MARESKQVTDKQKKMIQYLRSNPIIAANKLLMRNGRPMQLTWYQRRILKDLWAGKPYTLLIMGRGTGKTFTLAVFLVLRCMLFPREKCGIVGPTYRQAQYVFDEVIRIWEESEHLQLSTKKPPAKTPTQCELNFVNGSQIIALPLGNDGNKIRGARFWRLVADELAQIPEDIIDTVLLPFLNTNKDPMSGDVSSGNQNQLVMASSAYYQFNHLYNKYVEYSKFMEEGNEDYAVHRYTYLDTPPGFISKKNIEHQRRTVPRIRFLMENLCVFPADSDGFFPASLLQSIKSENVALEPIVGDKGAEYVLGIDPARQSDNCAIVVIRLGAQNKVVRVDTLHRWSFPKMTDHIRKILRDYNVVRIAMDAGGGGTTIRDLLAEDALVMNSSTGQLEHFEPIFEVDNKETMYKRGRHILELVNFSPKEINAMNFDLKADMENRRILVPSVPKGSTDLATLSQQEDMYPQIEEMLNETENVVATPLRTGGMLHFDTPSKSLKKDRYSALLLAAKAAREYGRSDVEKEKKPLAIGRWVNGGYLLGRI